MDILFLSHCVPNPPDKGEKIRAYHELAHLAERYRVHLACFARSRAEMEDALALKDRCASVYVESLEAGRSLAGAGLRYLAGGCLTASFYGSRRMRRHIRSLAARPISVSVAYSSAMAQYAPAGIPLLLDMVDVDSEKWLQYGRMRRPGVLYRIEGRRLRRLEAAFVSRAACTFVSTRNEVRLLESFAPAADIHCMENGVDFARFDPSAAGEPLPELRGRRFVAFVGAMDYYPNRDAACWFASRVFEPLRQRRPEVEFIAVGRNPSAEVRRLAGRPGIAVTGAVEDVRPYLQAAEAVVAPLRIARGIQNKVLEALAMGKCVLASPAVCETFGGKLPAGVVRCNSERDYLEFLSSGRQGPSGVEIRGEARRRFAWDSNLAEIGAALESMLACAVEGS